MLRKHFFAYFALLLAASFFVAGLSLQTFQPVEQAYVSSSLNSHNQYASGVLLKETVLIVSGDGYRPFKGTYSYYDYTYVFPTPFPSPQPTIRPTATPSPTPKPKCVDATPVGECSVNKPNFCNSNRLLVARASVCGCPSGSTVDGEQCLQPSPTPSPTPFARPSPSPQPTDTPTPTPSPAAPTPEPDHVSRLFYFKVTKANGFEQKFFAAEKGDVINFRVSTDVLGLGHSITIPDYGIDLVINATNNSEPNNAIFFLNKSGTFSVTCGHCNALNYPNGLANFIGTLKVS